MGRTDRELRRIPAVDVTFEADPKSEEVFARLERAFRRAAVIVERYSRIHSLNELGVHRLIAYSLERILNHADFLDWIDL